MNMQIHSEPNGRSMDALLASFAAGTLPRALHALVGAHLELNPVSRDYVASLEASLAAGVEKGEMLPVHHRRARLDAIFALEPVALREADDELRSLRHFAGRGLAELRFGTILPGVKECRIATDDGTTAVFYRIAPGRKLPQHTHEGSEYTLVIRGAFRDETGRYGRGDVAISDEAIDHTPVAEGNEECLCFAVFDGPLRLTGPIGRFFNRLVRH